MAAYLASEKAVCLKSLSLALFGTRVFSLLEKAMLPSLRSLRIMSDEPLRDLLCLPSLARLHQLHVRACPTQEQALALEVLGDDSRCPDLEVMTIGDRLPESVVARFRSLRPGVRLV